MVIERPLLDIDGRKQSFWLNELEFLVKNFTPEHFCDPSIDKNNFWHSGDKKMGLFYGNGHYPEKKLYVVRVCSPIVLEGYWGKDTKSIASGMRIGFTNELFNCGENVTLRI